MRFLIPRHILDKGTAEEQHGSFPASVLFVDISGFTKLTSALMRQGDEGAETLSEIINKVFAPVIEVIESAGGFVSSFAGDAATALFPEAPIDVAASAGLKIQRAFDTHHLQRTSVGEFALEARVGIGYGDIEWGAVHGETRSTYYYRGDGIAQATAAQERCPLGEVLAAPKAAEAAQGAGGKGGPAGKKLVLEPGEGGYARVTRASERDPEPGAPAEKGSPTGAVAEPAEAETAQTRYVPLGALPATGLGEFRKVNSVFVSFADPGGAQSTAEAVRPLLDLAESYGGYFNLLDFADKGPLALILFGAPRAQEDDEERAGDFALAAAQLMGSSSRIGITSGTVFAGFVGAGDRATYTALGATVNLAARLAIGADPGQVVTAEAAATALKDRLTLEELYRRKYKGFSEEIPVYVVSASSGRGAEEIPFVGREDQVSQLQSGIQGLLAGNLPTYYVLGEAGTGKSRLVHRAVGTFGDSRLLIYLEVDTILRKSMNALPRLVRSAFDAAGIDIDASEASEATDRLIAQLEEAGASSEVATRLRRSASGLLSLLDRAPQDSLYAELDPQGRFELVATAVSSLVEGLATSRGLVLVIDNAHALDAETREIFARMVGTGGVAGRAVVIVGRGEPSTSPFGVEDDVAGEQIMLVRGLSPQEIGEMASYIIGGPAADDLVDFVLRRVGTNTLYVSEFCRYLSNKRLLVRDDGGYRLTTEEVSLPTGINALLVARVDSLPPRTKEAAQAAAVLGTEFDPIVLEKLVEGDGDFTDILAAGEAAGLWAPGDGGRYRFRQALVREALEEMQLAGTLKKLHARAAALLEQLNPGEPSLNADLAYHYIRAEMPDEACEALRRAADYAISNFKNEKALEFLRTYQKYERRAAHRIDGYNDMAAIYELTGAWQEAIDTLVYALGLSVISGDLEARARLLTNLGEVYRKQSNTESATTILTQAKQLATKVGNSLLIAEALVHLGQSYWAQGDFPTALTHLEEALKTARGIDNLRLEALALYYQGVVYRDQNRYDQADTNFRRAHELFEQIGDTRLSTYPLYDLGVVRLYQGAIDEAKGYFERALSVYQQIGYESGASAAILNLGVLRDRRGDFAGAIKYYEESRKIAEQLKEHMAIGYTLFSIGATYYKMGDNRKALEYLKDAFTNLKKLGAKGYYGYVLSYLVSLLARTGNVEQAIRTAYQHTHVVENVGSDPENGRAVMSVGTALERGVHLSETARKQLDHIAGYYGITEHSPEAFYLKAIEISEPTQYVDTLIPAHFRYAEYLRAAGRKDEFREHLGRAFQLAAEAHWDRFIQKTSRSQGETLRELGIDTNVEVEFRLSQSD